MDSNTIFDWCNSAWFLCKLSLKNFQYLEGFKIPSYPSNLVLHFQTIASTPECFSGTVLSCSSEVNQPIIHVESVTSSVVPSLLDVCCCLYPSHYVLALILASNIGKVFFAVPWRDVDKEWKIPHYHDKYLIYSSSLLAPRFDRRLQLMLINGTFRKSLNYSCFSLALHSFVKPKFILHIESDSRTIGDTFT